MVTSLQQSAMAPVLRAKFQDAQEYVRVVALAELLKSGATPVPAIEDAATCLDDPNPLVRELAVTVLAQAGAPAAAVLTQALDERQPVSVRIAAASGLSRMGAGAAPAANPLCRCLENSDDQLRWHAAFALGKIGRDAVAALQGILSSSNVGVLCAAVSALGWVGKDAGGAVEAVKRLALSSSPTVRIACHAAIARITGDSSTSLPEMMRVLEDKDPGVRQAAVQSLGDLGAVARQSAPRLLRCATDPSSGVRAASALALARIGAAGPQTVQILTKLLQDPEVEVRANAGIALAKLGSEAETALPALHAIRTDGNPRVSAIAMAAVESISKAK